MTEMTKTMNVAANVEIVEFMNKAEAFLNESCVPGTGAAVSRAAVAKAGGLSEENDGLISGLIAAGFFPGWKIRQGRDGGVCRVGEEAPKGPNPNKYNQEWLSQLMVVLGTHVPLNNKVPVTRNVIARELAKLTTEDVLLLPNKISEAISMGRCPGYSSKRGSGIFRTEAPAEVLPVSADGAESEQTAEVPSAVEAATEATVESASNESSKPEASKKGSRRSSKKQ